ncbi:unnamed protein product [Dicrocoelium dendriticum]|nr:unnamed protein product [Dicrocoelium dendriticum]
MASGMLFHRSAYMTRKKSKRLALQIRKFICFALLLRIVQVVSWAESDEQLRTLQLKCNLVGPTRRLPVGYFRTQFKGHAALDQAKVVDTFIKTISAEASTYDIDWVQFRFRQHPITSERSELSF